MSQDHNQYTRVVLVGTNVILANQFEYMTDAQLVSWICHNETFDAKLALWQTHPWRRRQIIEGVHRAGCHRGVSLRDYSRPQDAIIIISHDVLI